MADNPEKVAFIYTQVACCQAELAAMWAANQLAASRGIAPPYVYKDFMVLQEKYLIGHNAVLGYLAPHN